MIVNLSTETGQSHEELFELRAYCLMPDHAHLLVKGFDKQSDLRQFAKTAKERSGRAYRKRSGHRLWQEGYFDRVLRDEGDARRYAQYIVTDPVRAGLVATPADYPFVGCTEWSLDELFRDMTNALSIEGYFQSHERRA